MPKIVIDGVEYNSEDLDEHGQAQLSSLRFVVNKIQSLEDEIKILDTAKKAYISALKAQLASKAG